MENKTPQLEDGYTKIANEILEALAKLMPGLTEGQIIYAILRKTYGWHKKEDKISISQLVEMTGKSKRMIIYALQNLEAKKIVFIKRTTLNKEKQPNTIMFNKNHKEWVVQKVALQVKKNREQARISSAKHYTTKIGSAKGCKEVVQKVVKNINSFAHTKDTIQKIITKDTNKGITLFKKINPSYERLYKNKTERASVDRLIKKYSFKWLESAVRKLPEINAMPYSPKVTSPYELEMKLGKIRIFLQQEKNKNPRRGVAKV